MTNVFNMLFNVVITKSMKKSHSGNFYHYKKIEDCLNFDGVTFPANNDIDRFEELNHNVSVNVFGVDEEQEQTSQVSQVKKVQVKEVKSRKFKSSKWGQAIQGNLAKSC